MNINSVSKNLQSPARARRPGFTLVELLVVIAIIGLLSTIAFISLNRARAKARDAKRVSDVRQLQSALELFYNDQSPPEYPRNKAAGGGQAIDSTILPSQYVSSVPQAPEPDDPPDCPDATNRYAYFSYENEQLATDCDNASQDCGWYQLQFCIGAPTGGLAAGVHNATPSGIN